MTSAKTIKYSTVSLHALVTSLRNVILPRHFLSAYIFDKEICPASEMRRVVSSWHTTHLLLRRIALMEISVSCWLSMAHRNINVALIRLYDSNLHSNNEHYILVDLPLQAKSLSGLLRKWQVADISGCYDEFLDIQSTQCSEAYGNNLGKTSYRNKRGKWHTKHYGTLQFGAVTRMNT